MSYELQVYALSPVRPSPRQLLARTGDSGLELEMAKAPGAATGDADTRWERVLLRASDAEAGGFLVEASPELDRMKAQFRQDVAEGDSVPEQVFDATQLYVLELDVESPGGEEHQAAFVVAAWALASLCEGIVFDPQEELFADADSFWGVITDESLGDAEAGGCEDDEHDHDHESDHAGGCCSTGGIDIELPRETGGASRRAGTTIAHQGRSATEEK